MLVNLTEKHFKEEGSFIEEEGEEYHSKIKNLMAQEIKILILKAVVEAGEEVVEDSQ
jgi:hemerythrin